MSPTVHWPGWWGKIALFSPDTPTTEHNLWLDLDIVITGNLDAMVEKYRDSHLACAKNWAQSGHGGCQSSVMLWKGGKGNQAESAIYRAFDPKDAHWPPINQPGVYLWGDQEFITQQRDNGHLAVTHFDEHLIKSYKYHCRNGLPQGCVAVVFHGNPKPGDSSVQEDWYKW